jgi:hypothetical protein
MGFFDSVKQLKNVITGGAAKVYLDCPHVSFEAPFLVHIRVQTLDSPVTVNRVYLYVQGIEKIEVPDEDISYDSDGRLDRKRETVRASHVTVNLDITVAPGQELAPNQSYEWTTTVTLPQQAPPIYHGRFCQHRYQAFAGLDCFGNDPDSGWLVLNTVI